MSRTIEKLQIYALSELLTREDQLEIDLQGIDTLDVVSMYFDNGSQQFEHVHSQPAFFTLAQTMATGMKQIIKANIQAELDKVRAEKLAVGNPIVKVEKALNMAVLEPTTEAEAA